MASYLGDPYKELLLLFGVGQATIDAYTGVPSERRVLSSMELPTFALAPSFSRVDIFVSSHRSANLTVSLLRPGSSSPSYLDSDVTIFDLPDQTVFSLTDPAPGEWTTLIESYGNDEVSVIGNKDASPEISNFKLVKHIDGPEHSFNVPVKGRLLLPGEPVLVQASKGDEMQDLSMSMVAEDGTVLGSSIISANNEVEVASDRVVMDLGSAGTDPFYIEATFVHDSTMRQRRSTLFLTETLGVKFWVNAGNISDAQVGSAAEMAHSQ